MSGLLLKADFSSHIGSVGFVPILLQKSEIVVARLLRRFAEAVSAALYEAVRHCPVDTDIRIA
jgi:hypothetical protein